ncbi:hypothetical protein EST38_g13984 [Candolleomyces aberdarensis]|uniref:Uncharacterized protein n=1 Tax=Candolleomyces aberdarensis TaxID=2316362 RepID=A0A4Q2CZM6_9AGAR|nr:hypothetical protein EST38_g13984 [Candolleomyces aberdarensis]
MYTNPPDNPPVTREDEYNEDDGDDEDEKGEDNEDEDEGGEEDEEEGGEDKDTTTTTRRISSISMIPNVSTPPSRRISLNLSSDGGGSMMERNALHPQSGPSIPLPAPPPPQLLPTFSDTFPPQLPPLGIPPPNVSAPSSSTPGGTKSKKPSWLKHLNPAAVLKVFALRDAVTTNRGGPPDRVQKIRDALGLKTMSTLAFVSSRRPPPTANTHGSFGHLRASQASFNPENIANSNYGTVLKFHISNIFS